MTVNATTFVVKRNNLHDGKFVEQKLDLKPGGAILKVDHFALTANNITYAAFGEAMKYWDFFPAPQAGLGVIPVWGFGTVVESTAEGLKPGDRFYGYFPFASHLAVEPVQVSGNGFRDGAAHRQPMAAVYSNYTRTSADTLYDADSEAEQILLRPLFTTSFAIDDLLDDNDYFGASAVLLSSASSKTAYSAAHLLKKRRSAEIIGLTSPANLAFVKGLGCYDRVVAYDDVAAIAASTPVAYIDMTGNVKLRSAVHHHFADTLKYDCAVGATNWDADRSGASDALPGAKTQMFFAPTQIAKRVAEWGAKGFNERLATAWRDFVATVRNERSPWIRVIRGKGAAEAQRFYSETLEGRTPPLNGIVLSL
jgi:hypothetical protein